ncbi:hypothetical protein BK049_12055 [Bacillus xiamenensis]|uniref:Uncharacterized protein n=1 Tax=Bacillus xiamenensis TaxID=1178537 RepID=A0AAC9IHG9_9BACI|nr:hypothetical protein BK049_12055 [Bacillus xiamenensis]
MCFSCHDAYSCSVFCSSTHYIKGEFIQQDLFLKKKGQNSWLIGKTFYNKKEIMLTLTIRMRFG